MARIGPLGRITVAPGKCGGKPRICGRGITVRRVIELIAAYPHREDSFREYPFLGEEDLQQALPYAAATVDVEVLVLNSVG